MCIGDDENEKLEFEMTLNLLNHNKTNNNNSFNYILSGLILLLLLIFFCFILTFLIYFSLKKSSSIEKANSLTIHHDVMLTIQHLSEQNSLWNQSPYHTLDYIDEQPISCSWIKHLNSEIKQEQIPSKYSTRHRNVNRQLSVNISDRTFSPLIKFNEKYNDIEILKISVPLLNQYPLIKSSNSIISFDSQNELDEFNQMTSICMDNELDRQS